jgi:hypothetical protein
VLILPEDLHIETVLLQITRVVLPVFTLTIILMWLRIFPLLQINGMAGGVTRGLSVDLGQLVFRHLARPILIILIGVLVTEPDFLPQDRFIRAVSMPLILMVLFISHPTQSIGKIGNDWVQ